MGIPRPVIVALIPFAAAIVCICSAPAQERLPSPAGATVGWSGEPAPTRVAQRVWFADDSATYAAQEPIIGTNGWPVAMPFSHAQPSSVYDQSSGAYPSFVPGATPDDCFCTPPPCYFGTFYISGVVLDRRTNLRPAGLLYDPTLTNELANASEFNLNTAGGVRFGFWLAHPCGVDWNLEYLTAGRFEDTIAREDPATLNAVFFGDSFAVAPTAITAEYESRLDSLEIQLRARQWPRVAPLFGIRFVQVDEEFNVLNDLTNRTGFFSHSDNELFGFQFGVQALLYEWSRARFETTIKAGPYYNDIDIETTDEAGVVTAANTDASAFVGDARVTFVYQLGPRASFRISYQALWIDGVALAPNQNTPRNFQPPIGPVDLSDVLYQGGDVGIELSW